MSRTDNLRNARCLLEMESTTKRANSRTNRSSVRHFIKNAARSFEVGLRLRVTEMGSDTPGDARKASRKRFLGALHNLHSKRVCHSESRHCCLLDL